MQPTYVDLFATKGIEYLVVIGFLIALGLFWRVLRSPAAFAAAPARSPGRRGPGWFAVAPEPYYHPGHSWARPGDGLVVVGIDDFASKLIGRPSEIDLPLPGARLEQGERGFGLQVGSRSVQLLSPVDGIVEAVNPRVLRDPSLVDRDPYGSGWLLQVRPSRLRANLRGLLRGGLAEAWMREAESALRARVSPEVGAVLQDGGVPVDGIARSLAPERWDELAAELLLTR